MIILLDIDGVMVPLAGWKLPELLNDRFPDFSVRAVHSLNKIITATGATIVLTIAHKFRYTLPQWEQIFKTRGITASVFRQSEDMPFRSRREEILNWYNTRKGTDNFVIIDDDKSLNDLPATLKISLVITSSLIGLTDGLADKAIEILRYPLATHVSNP